MYLTKSTGTNNIQVQDFDFWQFLTSFATKSHILSELIPKLNSSVKKGPIFL
jgi:hypothetical protein